MGAAARSVENAAGVSLGELIDFCARCVALGIPESTKLRAVTDVHTALLAVIAETQFATPLASVDPANGEDCVIIEIPDEE
jgi:hypothetical protein